MWTEVPPCLPSLKEFKGVCYEAVLTSIYTSSHSLHSAGQSSTVNYLIKRRPK